MNLLNRADGVMDGCDLFINLMTDLETIHIFLLDFTGFNMFLNVSISSDLGSVAGLYGTGCNLNQKKICLELSHSTDQTCLMHFCPL